MVCMMNDGTFLGTDRVLIILVGNWLKTWLLSGGGDGGHSSSSLIVIIIDNNIGTGCPARGRQGNIRGGSRGFHGCQNRGPFGTSAAPNAAALGRKTGGVSLFVLSLNQVKV